MNPTALAVMLAITGLWLGLLAAALLLGSPALLALFVVATAAMFVPRRWFG